MKLPKRKIILVILTCSLFTAGVGYFIYSLNRPKDFNVILISIDSLRPDHLGCYGYKRNTSPYIDKLAEEGVIFSEAISQASYTQKSVPSFVTSTYPYMHLVYHKEHIAYLSPQTDSLPVILRKNHYLTGLFTDHPTFFGRIQGIKNGIEDYKEIKTNSPEELNKLGLNWLAKNKNKKFFLWLYFFGAHGPYNPSLPYSDNFLNDNLSKINKVIPKSSDDALEVFGVIPQHISENGISDVGCYIAKYDGKIRVIDDQIGLLLQEIKDLGLDNRTLIILMSDHGEGLGEHDYYFRHGATLYDELLRVPLIIKVPNNTSYKRIISCQVELIDVLPTILDILKIRKTRRIVGQSLKPYLLGKNCNDEKYAFSNTSFVYSMRNREWKLIYIDRKAIKNSAVLFKRYWDYYRNDYELYNLKEDPFESQNLINKERRVLETLKVKLDKYVLEAKRQALENEAKIKDFFKQGNGIRFLDQETKDRLKEIGYMQ